MSEPKELTKGRNDTCVSSNRQAPRLPYEVRWQSGAATPLSCVRNGFGWYGGIVRPNPALVRTQTRTRPSAGQNSGQEVPLNDRLGTWVAAKYAMAAALDDGSDPNWKLLHQVCHDVSELRRKDHAAMRLRLERKRLEQSRKHDGDTPDQGAPD